MITADTYKTYLLSQGSNMSQIKINHGKYGYESNIYYRSNI